MWWWKNWWYFRVVANRPGTYLLVLSLILTAMAAWIVVLELKTAKPLRFSYPSLGFEARHTDIAAATMTYNHIKRSTLLVSDPDELIKPLKMQLPDSIEQTEEQLTSSHGFCGSPTSYHARLVFQRPRQNNLTLLRLDALQSMCAIEQRIAALPAYAAPRCPNHPSSASNQSDEIPSSTAIPPSSASGGDQSKTPSCQHWSLPGYVVLVNELRTCSELNDTHVVQAEQLLNDCLTFYRNGGLQTTTSMPLAVKEEECTVDGAHNNCTTLRRKCQRDRPVYAMLQHLVVVRANAVPPFVGFGITTHEMTWTEMTAALMLLPLANGSNALQLYDELQSISLSDSVVAVRAMDLGAAAEPLFERLLLHDVWFIALSGAVLLTCVYVYVRSLLLMLLWMISMMFSMQLTFTLYRWVLCIEFFPYTNLLALLVNIVLGTDYLLVLMNFFRYWLGEGRHSTSDMTDRERTEIMYYSIIYVLVTNGMTSLVALCAFFVTAFSSITTIKCFGTYASLTVFCNFAIMLTLVPAATAFVHRSARQEDAAASKSRWHEWCTAKWRRLRARWIAFKKLSIQSLTAYLSNETIRPRRMKLIAFSLCCILVAIVTIYSGLIDLPKLFPLQNGQPMPLFHSDHPFEVYNREVARRFSTTHPAAANITGELLSTDLQVSLLFVLGLRAEDDGSAFEPNDRGTLRLDDDDNDDDGGFDANADETQLWLRQFCTELHQQPFVLKSNAKTCFIESFITYMNRSCTQHASNETTEAAVNPEPPLCCDLPEFPYRPAVFRQCLPEYVRKLRPHMDGGGGPLFVLRHNDSLRDTYAQMQAFVIEVHTHTARNATYTQLRALYTNVSDWLTGEMLLAPPTMRHAFVHSGDWYAYELQRSLYVGMYWTVYSTLVLLMGIVYFCNYGNWTGVVCTYSTSAYGILVAIWLILLSDGQLGMPESIAISCASGLLVDYSVFYAMMFQTRRWKVCEGSWGERKRALVSEVFDLLGGPKTWAMLSVWLASRCALPAEVLPYQQLVWSMVRQRVFGWVLAAIMLMVLVGQCGPSRLAFAESRNTRTPLMRLWLWVRRRPCPPAVGPRVAARRAQLGDGDFDEETSSLELDMLEDEIGSAEDGLSPETMVELRTKAARIKKTEQI